MKGVEAGPIVFMVAKPSELSTMRVPRLVYKSLLLASAVKKGKNEPLKK